MKKLIVTIIFILTIFSPSTRSAGAGTLPVNELEAGMRGYGKTVFSGQRVDTFAVEILGVMEKVMPDQDLILIRAEGDTLAHTNIISGMSGSPIYINEKLIGALAYSWAFEKEPIAGVTPVENIKNSTDFSAVQNNNNLQRITTPLVASGFSDNSLEYIREKFERLKVPVQFIGGGNPGNKELDFEAIENLEAGSAVGIQMVRGDLNMAAIGTATEIDRKTGKVYALGHPFLSAGEIELPMTSARVQTFIPSLQSSFKIASPDRTIGVITEDRQATVTGQLGRQADLLPVNITLDSPDNNINQDYKVEIIRNEFLTPGLLNSVAGSFAQARLQQLGVNKIITEINLEIDELPDLNIFRVASASASLDYQPFQELQQLWMNKFQKPYVKNVDLNITLEKGDKSAQITNLWADRSHVSPGGEVTVYIELDPHREEKQVRSFDFNLPENLPGEEIYLSAVPGPMLTRREPAPENISQLINNLNRKKNHAKLAVAVEYPGLNMNFAGHQYENIPPAIARMFRPDKNRQIRPLPSMIKQTIPTGWSLSGNQSIRLPVKSK